MKKNIFFHENNFRRTTVKACFPCCYQRKMQSYGDKVMVITVIVITKLK